MLDYQSVGSRRWPIGFKAQTKQSPLEIVTFFIWNRKFYVGVLLVGLVLKDFVIYFPEVDSSVHILE